MNTIPIKPEMFTWACERSGLPEQYLEKRFPKIGKWVSGEAKPTFKQLEAFAKATFTPIGYLFLPEPPVEKIPIPDFRTVNNDRMDRPSPDLLETVYLCQQRQAWYHDYAKSMQIDPLDFINSVTLKTPIEKVAETIRQALHFDLEERSQCPTWSEALRHFIYQADTLGIMVMCSGVVMNNNRRKLNPNEFRGFAIVDKLAPLVFINGSDTKAAQMFTLAHELAHLWLGKSALSNADISTLPENEVERWCNQVAAELLVPLKVIQEDFDSKARLEDEMIRLARQFKVSTLVILRRVFDAGKISRKKLSETYVEELERLKKIPKGTGGNFYLTLPARVSQRFARALIANTLEGQTLFRDAFRMLGISKTKTLQEIGRSLGMPL